LKGGLDPVRKSGGNPWGGEALNDLDDLDDNTDTKSKKSAGQGLIDKKKAMLFGLPIDDSKSKKSGQSNKGGYGDNDYYAHDAGEDLDDVMVDNRNNSRGGGGPSYQPQARSQPARPKTGGN
jgi:hypothetical protein